GTGPFKYESFTPSKQSVFAANTNYWGGAPYVSRQVVNSSFADEGARMNALLSGAIDISPVVPPALAKANAANGQIHLGTAHSVETFSFNCRVDVAPFNDPRVVQALKLLCDRQQMVDSVFSGYASQSNDLYGPGLPYYADSGVLPVRRHDPEQARSLLQTAGHSDLTVTIYTSDLAAGWVDGATLYAQQAAAGGVKVKVVKVNPSVYYTTQGPAGGYLSYPIDIGDPGVGSSIPSLTSIHLTNVLSKGPYNEQHFGDAQTDKLLLDAIGELDEGKAQDKWNAIQEVEYKRGGMIVFGAKDSVDGYATRVRGVQTTPGGPVNNYDVTKAWLSKQLVRPRARQPAIEPGSGVSAAYSPL
ncbi:MAG TPA: ABC transporter substrate-binding protein, partial [Baekduia sp.]|nr:ABC transporter substrate-binding protein [Baekduia sp.]